MGRYRWVELRLFEVVGAWVPTVPEPEVKVQLASQSHKHAWHAEIWRERLPRLGDLDPGKLTVAANAGVGALLEALAEPQSPDESIEKLAGLYRVVIPRTVAAYTCHLRAANPVADGATIRWLRFVLQDVIDDWRDGEILLQSLIRGSEQAERAAAVGLRLDRLATGAGGIAGRTGPPTAPPDGPHDGALGPNPGAG